MAFSLDAALMCLTGVVLAFQVVCLYFVAYKGMVVSLVYRKRRSYADAGIGYLLYKIRSGKSTVTKRDNRVTGSCIPEVILTDRVVGHVEVEGVDFPGHGVDEVHDRVVVRPVHAVTQVDAAHLADITVRHVRPSRR